MKVFVVGVHRGAKSTVVNLLRKLGVGAVKDEVYETYKELYALASSYYRAGMQNPEEYKDALRRLVPDARVTANVAYYPFILLLDEMYPGSRFLLMKRDGVQQVASYMEGTVYTPRDRYGDVRLEPPERYVTRFEKCCWYWNELNRIMLDDLEQVEHMHCDLFALTDFFGYGMGRQYELPDEWRQRFIEICGETQVRMGYGLPQ